MKKSDSELIETQHQFKEFYLQKLQKIYAELELTRHEYIKTLLQRAGIYMIAALIIVIMYISGLVSIQNTHTFFVVSAIAIVLAYLGAVWINQPFLDYCAETKERVMKIILSFWGDFRYGYKKDMIGKKILKESEMFPFFDTIKADDIISGRYNNVGVNITEQTLSIHGSKGDMHVFGGALILLDFPKKFKGKTTVLCKNSWLKNPLIMMSLFFCLIIVAVFLASYRPEASLDDYAIVGAISMKILLIALLAIFLIFIDRKKNPRQAIKKVVLEGLSFMRRWNVMTDNQIEARYLLTPVLMEKMLEVKRHFGGNHIEFSFFNNQLLIAVHTNKNMFETTSLFTPALSYHKVSEVVSQFHAIFSIIDILLSVPEAEDKKLISNHQKSRKALQKNKK